MDWYSTSARSNSASTLDSEYLAAQHTEKGFRTCPSPRSAAFHRFIDTPFAVAALREANGKLLNIRDLVERFFGRLPDKTEFAKVTARFHNCLDYLREREAVEQVEVPGRRGASGLLTAVADDNIPLKVTLPKPKGKPEAKLADQERRKMVKILAEAQQALGTTDITRRALILNGEQPSEERLEHGVHLVRLWLARLRKDGIIRSIKPPTGYELKWGLVSWRDEIAAHFGTEQSADGSE